MANALELLPEPDVGTRQVLTIDLLPRPHATFGRPPVTEQPLWMRRVVGLFGKSSTDATVVEDVRRRVQGRKVSVILDSAHDEVHVLAELHAYAPLVSVGQYLIVEDTHQTAGREGHPVGLEGGGGPMVAVQAFMRTEFYQRHFIWDQHVQFRLYLTHHPYGYHRRVS